MRAPDQTLWDDAKALEAWTNAELNRLDAEHAREFLKDHTHVIGRPRPDPIVAAKQRAQRGDYEPLRKLFPELAPFLNPPKRKRGERSWPHDPLRKFMTSHNACEAIEDAKRIRKLWRARFGIGIRKEAPTAEQIATRRNRITIQQLHNFRSNRGRKNLP